MKWTAMPKVKTGIPGLDNITKGGFPLGRTVVAGTAGSGKTVLAAQFLQGGIELGEPGRRSPTPSAGGAQDARFTARQGDPRVHDGLDGHAHRSSLPPVARSAGRGAPAAR